MNNEHTKEPWKIADSGYSYTEGIGNCIPIYSRDGTWLIGFVLKKEGVVCNARRIVACVNACEGIAIEVLESGVAKDVLMNFASTVIEFDLIKKQNRELLEACISAIEALTESDGGHAVGESNVRDAVNELRAAIAKATNQTT